LKSGLNAADVAAALQGKIAGVTSLIPIGPHALLYSIDPSKVTGTSAPATKPTTGSKASKSRKTSKSTTTVSAETVEAQLLSVLEDLPIVTVTPEVLNLPDGSIGACAIITMIGHQVAGVASLAAISDTRILAGFTGSDQDVDVASSKLKRLIEGLAISTVAPAPPVQSVAMRLYYDRNAASVATAVGTAFSQLKVSPVSMNPANTYMDSIILADPTGDTSRKTLDQARRMIAQLDEPRAQLVVNAWSLQLSSDKQENTSELVPQARRLASGYNDALESAVMRGWNYLNHTAPGTAGVHDYPIDLDPVFSGYLSTPVIYTKNAIAVLLRTTEPSGSHLVTPNLDYALGYNTLFGSEAPDLIQLLIMVMATKNPGKTIEEAIKKMEGMRDSLQRAPESTLTTESISTETSGYESCQEIDKRFYKKQDELYKPPPNVKSGAEGFYKLVERQNAPPYVGFACTRAKLEEMARKTDVGAQYSTSAIGQFRAAVADYLFQNKMKAEYPNDFEPFLYPQSAATLDAVLTPVVEAFNQDLEALQQHLQYQLTNDVKQDKHLHYTSNGLVSVKVVSGNQAMVQTQSLNYFPQNPTIKLEDFAKALAAGETSTSTVPLLGGTLSSVVSAIGAYSAAKPAQVTAKVGSGLALTVTPYTLSSARGAELNVNVTYNENAAATLSSDTTQSQASDDLNSRVSEHEVSTLVRMDSLKFFEISTMQSVIARQKARYKLIDPVVELPILDGLAFGARRKPEVIYNQSIIFMEASIMPTAADLGQGLVFRYDLVEPGADRKKMEHDSKKTEPCGEAARQESNELCVEAHNEADFRHDELLNESVIGRIIDYHKRMVAYFAGQYIGSDGTVQNPAHVHVPTLYVETPSEPERQN
jgi:hypothetical protein